MTPFNHSNVSIQAEPTTAAKTQQKAETRCSCGEPMVAFAGYDDQGQPDGWCQDNPSPPRRHQDGTPFERRR